MWAINREPDILKIKQAVSLLPLGDAAVSPHCSSPLESEKKLHDVYTRVASEFLSQRLYLNGFLFFRTVERHNIEIT